MLLSSSRPSFEEAGGKVTSTNGINSGDVDFHAVLTKIDSENPDMVYYGGICKEAGLIVKQMREAGMKQVFFGPDQCYSPEFIKNGGTEAEGAYVSYEGPPLDSTPELKSFTTSTPPSTAPALSWPSSATCPCSWSKPPSTRRARRQGRASPTPSMPNTYQTILGPYAFEANGAMKGGGTIYIYQVKNGAFAFIGAATDPVDSGRE